MKLDHINWNTQNFHIFESFWCDCLGFIPIFESTMPAEKTISLFRMQELYDENEVHPYLDPNHPAAAIIRRYKSPDQSFEIEAHRFNEDYLKPDHDFIPNLGINHISLKFSPGRREEWIKTVQEKARDIGQTIRVYRYANNVKGQSWDNIFIRDFEDNWIELREVA